MKKNQKNIYVEKIERLFLIESMSIDESGAVHVKTHWNGKPVTIDLYDDRMELMCLNDTLTHNLKMWNRILSDNELKSIVEIVAPYNDDEFDIDF